MLMSSFAPESVDIPSGAEVVLLPTADGRQLRAAFWPSTSASPSGTVFVLQGRAEFMEKYGEVYADALARGFAIASMDWRGQGGSSRLLSNRRKGHVEDFADYFIDLDCLAAEAARRALPKPWHIIAHSMGAGITLLKLAEGPSPFARAVLSAPLVKIHGLKHEPTTRAFAKFLTSIGLGAMFVPFGNAKSIMEKPFEGNPLTRDAARYARSQQRLKNCSDLSIGDATIGWVDAAFHALAAFDREDFGRLNRTPVLILIAGADAIVDSRASEALALKMRGASAIVIPGARHEILMETDDARNEFWRAFDAFTSRPATSVSADEPLPDADTASVPPSDQAVQTPAE